MCRTVFASIVCFWAFALSFLTAEATIAVEASAAQEYIEPEVHRYTNVIPREVCEKIIALGEAAGFPLEPDSIDSLEYQDSENNSSQAIDVVDEDGTVNYPEIYAELEPYIPKIANLIRSQRNQKLDRILFPDEPADRLPELHWVFYRKYSPDTPRNALIPHTDINMHTVNIALNDDFTGGGLFYINPPRPSNPNYYPNENNNYFSQGVLDPVVDIYDYQTTYHYVNGLRHENTSNIVFPKLETGDALIHNFTVWHAVAPLDVGTRYSMVLFFDMHNPCLIDNDKFDQDEDEEEDYRFEITIRHQIKECDPSTGKLVPIRDSVDIYWVDPDEDQTIGTIQVVEENFAPGDFLILLSLDDHEFLAFRSVPDGQDPPALHRREVLASIVVQEGQDVYEFTSSFTTQEDCDARNEEEEDEL
eukprot:CAMPEP_0116147558 /NCGR_PEP_ID=MMETSP0329-20121206/17818_1 /TAXON_ID=697910 /ORGANISM="Pseudo-nitzschia arenysensis, Strain B593" /LENGTH=417 /DNA_ID=CAMNT_0003643493 /DNA_START=161 /DNA_END=1414 /DNA_ORIENTATION=-